VGSAQDSDFSLRPRSMLPIFPRGATVRSILAVASACGRRIVPNHAATVYLTGFGAPTILSSMLPDVAPADVLQRHTLAPLLLAIHPNALRPFILQLMMSPPRWVPTSYRRSSLSRHVRRCPICVSLDIDNGVGFAFSRVIHQLQNIRRCPDHGVALEENCAECGHPFSKLEKLASAPSSAKEQLAACRNCGATAGIPLHVHDCAGYEAYERLLVSTFAGGWTALDPVDRFALIADAAARSSEAGIDIREEFSRFWESDSYDSALIASGMKKDHLYEAFEGKRSFVPHEVLCIVSFAEHLLRRVGKSAIARRSVICSSGRKSPGRCLSMAGNASIVSTFPLSVTLLPRKIHLRRPTRLPPLRPAGGVQETIVMAKGTGTGGKSSGGSGSRSGAGGSGASSWGGRTSTHKNAPSGGGRSPAPGGECPRLPVVARRDLIGDGWLFP